MNPSVIIMSMYVNKVQSEPMCSQLNLTNSIICLVTMARDSHDLLYGGRYVMRRGI